MARAYPCTSLSTAFCSTTGREPDPALYTVCAEAERFFQSCFVGLLVFGVSLVSLHSTPAGSLIRPLSAYAGAPAAALLRHFSLALLSQDRKLAEVVLVEGRDEDERAIQQV